MYAGRKLTNQDAFDIAVLHLLNQGHCSVNASGRSKYRGPRGKSAIGALIPNDLYATTMEGRTIQQLLSGSSTDYAGLRERLGGVKPGLLSELQDLHDRVGECLPSLFRHLVLAGGQRIAQAFGLSARLLQRWATYQRIPGPQIVQTAAESVAPRAITQQPRLDRRTQSLKLVA